MAVVTLDYNCMENHVCSTEEKVIVYKWREGEYMIFILWLTFPLTLTKNYTHRLYKQTSHHTYITLISLYTLKT